MSHYAVAVFSDDADFERLLRPYGENNEAEYVFTPVDYQEIVADFERFKTRNKGWTLDNYIENNGYVLEDGVWGYRSNPHGYWDWYNLDGKDYLFDLKSDAEAEEGFNGYYRKNDYVWFADDSEARLEAEDFWDSFIGENAIAQPPGLWNKQYFLDRYKTREQYVKENARTIPYAFITPDGVWHAPGRVGWFATSDESAEDADRYAEEWEAYIRSDANPYVSLVDCHI